MNDSAAVSNIRKIPVLKGRDSFDIVGFFFVLLTPSTVDDVSVDPSPSRYKTKIALVSYSSVTVYDYYLRCDQQHNKPLQN